MIRYIILTVFLSFSIFMVRGFAQQPRFDEANSFLEEGQYMEAIDIYKSISQDGFESGALWLNTGVAYTRLDSLGMAKYYFLRAQKYPETEERASNALTYVNDRFPRESAVLPTLPWIRFINFLSDSIGLRTIVFTALFFLYIGVAFKIGAWFRLDLKKPFNYSGYSAIALSGILFLCSIIISYQENRYAKGVMIESQGVVYERPTQDSGTVSTVYEGYTMQVDETESAEHQGWKYVRLENGMYGWIRTDHIMYF